MEQAGELPPPFRMPPDSSGPANATEVDWIRIARTAIASGTVVLAAGLIAVTSAATLRIGPFGIAASAGGPSSIFHADVIPPSHPGHGGSDLSAQPTMLIAQDPGDEMWRQLLAGEGGSQHDSPISVASISALQPLRSVPTMAYRVIDAPLAWTKLSAIHTIDAWGAAIASAGGPQSSIFGKLLDPHVPTETAPFGTTASGTEATSTSTSSQSTQTSSPPAQSSPPPAVTSASNAPPVVTAQAPIPPILPPPPPQNSDTPPPSGGSSSGTTTPTSPVPEPANWITFILGFGLVGFGLRRNGRRPKAA